MTDHPSKETSDWKAKIEADIRKSGFPLEMHALNICSQHTTFRTPSLRYESDGKVQEVDLVASFVTEPHGKFETITELQYTTTTMVIECKKSAEKPWILFSSPYHILNELNELIVYVSDLDFVFGTAPLLQHIKGALSGHYLENPDIPRCLAYNEAFRKPEYPSTIFKAIDTLVSYLIYDQALVRAAGMRGVFSKFYVPVILLEGELFQASIKGDDIILTEERWLQLQTYYRGQSYVVEVVTKNAFESYVKGTSMLHLRIVDAINRLELPPHHLSYVAKAFLSK